MSAQNSAGIQSLLEAEKEAQKIVQKARTYRTQRLKDARSEADKEIEEYKRKKESVFQEHESEHTGSNNKAEDEANKKLEQDLAEIKQQAEKGKGDVLKMLIDAVTSAKAEMHVNATKA
ncbi:H(+)-transporting V1 sector ATPase subunit G [Saitoella coloradoensis]